MANEQSGIKFFVILTILYLSAVPCLSQEDDEEVGGPLMGALQAILKESSNKGQGNGFGIIGSMLQGMLQSSETGKQLGDFLSQGNKSPTLNFLSSLLQQKLNTKDNEGTGGFDPSMLGTVMDLLSSMNEAHAGNRQAKSEKSQGKASTRKQQDEGEGGTDWEPVLGMVGNVVSSMMAGNQGNDNNVGSGSPMESLLSFLPVIMSSIGGRHHPHASDNIKHHDHEPFLPPFLENIHEYWDHFTTSQFGRAIWENSGLSALAAQFQDENGNFTPALLFESLENNAFRRRLIKGISSFFAEWAKHVADAESQKKYLNTIQMVTNGFLQTEGYPKNALLNFNKPGDSISALVDEVLKRQLNFNVNSAQYVKPAINYFQDVFSSSKREGFLSSLTAPTIESKLSNTLEAQLVEPILRANRAYRFALRNQACAQYVLCYIETNSQKSKQDAMALKPAVSHISSLATAWYLSSAVDISFQDLLQARSSGNCKRYNDDCDEFHDEDSKATTEYFHNEL